MNFSGLKKRSSSLKAKFAILATGAGLIGLAAVVYLSGYFSIKDFEDLSREKTFLISQDVLSRLHGGMVS